MRNRLETWLRIRLSCCGSWVLSLTLSMGSQPKVFMHSNGIVKFTFQVDFKKAGLKARRPVIRILW